MNLRTEVFIFIGPPGAGKGSLSSLCVSRLGWIQLSTGNLCRKHISEQTEIGKQIDFAIKSGKLVSDNLVTRVVGDWFAENMGKAPAIILDGFPRTLAQAQALYEMLASQTSALQLKIIRLAISDEAVIERLCNRYICANVECQEVYSMAPGSTQVPKDEFRCSRCNSLLVRRKDDNQEAVRERLKIYHKHEQDLLNFYKNIKHEITELSVEKPLNEVFDEFIRLMGPVIQ